MWYDIPVRARKALYLRETVFSILACWGFGCGCCVVRPLADAGDSRAMLFASHRSVRPGETFELGLLLTVPRGWHTYGDPPGDAGMPPRLTLRAPDGFSVGLPRLPRAREFRDAAGMSRGYAGRVLFRIPITAPPSAASASVHPLHLNAQWLVCGQTCIPCETNLTISIAVAAERSVPAAEWADLLKQGQW